MMPASKVWSSCFAGHRDCLNFSVGRQKTFFPAYTVTCDCEYRPQNGKIEPEQGLSEPGKDDLSHFCALCCPQDVPACYLETNRVEHCRSASHSQLSQSCPPL